MSAAFPTKQIITACMAQGMDVSPAQVKLPARAHAAGAYRPGGDCPTPAAFGSLLGVPLVERVVRQGDWLYCDCSDAFFSACVQEALVVFPPLEGDRGSLVLNRALRLQVRAGTGCPPDAQAQRALLLALCAGEGKGARALAETALLTLYQNRSPRERQLLLDRSGALFSALGRVLSFYMKTT